MREILHPIDIPSLAKKLRKIMLNQQTYKIIKIIAKVKYIDFKKRSLTVELESDSTNRR